LGQEESDPLPVAFEDADQFVPDDFSFYDSGANEYGNVPGDSVWYEQPSPNQQPSYPSYGGDIPLNVALGQQQQPFYEEPAPFYQNAAAMQPQQQQDYWAAAQFDSAPERGQEWYFDQSSAGNNGFQYVDQGTVQQRPAPPMMGFGDSGMGNVVAPQQAFYVDDTNNDDQSQFYRGGDTFNNWYSPMGPDNAWEGDQQVRC
jgi:hypothetical protein